MWSPFMEYIDVSYRDESISKQTCCETALNEACKLVAGLCGSCPYDIYGYDIDCENTCGSRKMGECWKIYFKEFIKFLNNKNLCKIPCKIVLLPEHDAVNLF